MNLPDTNVWLALSLSNHLFHPAARDWFAAQAAERSVLFCRSTQQSLLRLLTTETVMRPYGVAQMSNAQAWEVYEQFLSDRRIAWTAEPGGVDARWQRLGARETASPKLWMDAYLAAFAIAASHRLITTDNGFKQFEGLNPVILAA